ncbi:DNA-binding transcriptional regulator, AcrR family [Amycolatopsis arida]|uniref:DNA-binding transcriptional regulator, AcrR family n=1 Tax=Amycolatopsis arida TaxID=587909 RepID=A0A1I5QFR5_9PSEU|nr:TetR/AcrR family transcriptional regulator [Amycolatopsis arida]TDX98825.1 AcrR family transcriptional regulator [Amycolatopsis arida]SFP45088.1 DNA-binding transcriptional regulator, AcrR family [Amycolatopsis arida]
MAVNTEPTSRERVRRAALKLFATKGFHGTGIRDVAQEARLSSASLYHYMGTKEELLAGLMREALERLLAAASAAVAGVDDPVERLRRLVALHVTTHARQPDETRVVDNEVRALSPRTRRAVVRLRDDYERLWAEAIDDGVRSGAFATDHPAVTRLALLEMCNGVARWYSPRGAVPLDRLAEHYAGLALRALGHTESLARAERP